MRMRSNVLQAMLLAIIGVSGTASAALQVPLDRSDPSLIVKSTEGDPQIARPVLREPLMIQAPSNDDSVGDRAIFVGAVQVDGARDVKSGPLIAASAPFIGHTMSASALKDLLGAISQVARSQGFLFARSSIPPQTLVAGVLHVRLDEGQIDRVELIGVPSAAVRQTLAPLIGKLALRSELERRLMLASDLPGISLGKVRYGLHDGQGVLTVTIRSDHVSASATVDNWGLRGSGPLRSEWMLDVNRVFNDHDVFSVQFVNTPASPRQLNFLFGRYATVLARSGVELAIHGSYGRTNSGSASGEIESTGITHALGAAVSAPVIRSRKASLWLSGTLDNFSVNQSSAGLPVRRDRLTTVRATLSGYLPLARGRLRGGAGITHGLNVFGATRADDPLASRAGASGNFTLVEAWANWTGRIAGPLSARAAIYGQLSNKSLLASEQLTIGGSSFGRAYDFSERSGDQGILSSIELRAQVHESSRGLVRSTQLYVFADAGRVTSRRDSWGTGSLASAGTGTRFTLSHHLKLEVEAAFPVNVVRYATNDKTPRIRFSLTRTF